MSYTFKEKITFKQYDDFIKKQPRLSYMQEEQWAKVKNIKEHKIVGVYKEKELCAITHVLVIQEKRKKRFYIPNGYLIDFKDKNVLKILTDNIIQLAKKENAYVVDIYPNITNNDTYFTVANKNLIELNYKYEDEYIDNTDNVLLPLIKNNKKIAKNILKKKYENKDFYTKRGIFFEVSNSIDDIDRLELLINKKYFNKDVVKKLIKTYKHRIKLIFAKLDLNYYKHFIEENNDEYNEMNKIEELLTISDEIDIGCALIIEPYNKIDKICEYIYNTELESFEHLDINNGILYEVMKICNKEDYDYIKISNNNLNVIPYIERYNASPIKYIGKYSLIIKKFTYYLNKPIKKKKKTV